jgi:hypothetical protein
VVVEAFVVNIKDAAAPDIAGLVNPLLHRYNAGGCHYSVFGLPAVQVGQHCSTSKDWYRLCLA